MIMTFIMFTNYAVLLNFPFIKKKKKPSQLFQQNNNNNTVSSTNIGTLGKYEQRQLWK